MVKCIVRGFIFSLVICGGLSASHLRIGTFGKPNSLDTAKMLTILEFNIAAQLFEGLTVYDPKDLSPKPGVARKWEVSASGLEYTFFLHENARWSDGTSIDAAVFKNSWLRVLKGKKKFYYRFLFFYIKNAEAFYEGKVPEHEVGIKIVDRYTLKVTLERATPFFLGLTSMPVFMPVPLHKMDSEWGKTSAMVTNGPFLLERWDHDTKLILKKSNLYRESHKILLEEVTFFFFEDEKKQFEVYDKWNLDWITYYGSDNIKDLLKHPDAKRGPVLATYFYFLNTNNKVLKDERIRKALSLAINRSFICREVMAGGEIPTYSFIPPRFPGYKSYKERENSDKARRLLKEAGYPGGKGFPGFTILINDFPEHRLIAQTVSTMWKDELNIHVKIEEVTARELRKRKDEKNFEIARASWFADYIDPSTFLDIFYSMEGSINVTGWQSNQYDELISKSRQEKDQTKRYELLYQAEKLLMSKNPIIPIYSYYTLCLLRSRVKGVYVNIFDIHPLKEVSIRYK